MTTVFSHSTGGLTAGTSNTLLYGPIATGTTGVVFAGTFDNNDATNQSTHQLTLLRYDGVSVYTPVLTQIPIPFGGTSMCPKMVLSAGESLYVSADTAGVISCAVEVLLLS